MVLVPGQNAIPVLASSPTQIAVITQVPLTTTNQQLIYRFSAEAGLGVVIT
jgi:hypothetical protein